MYEIFSELEISAVVHINTNNTTNNNHLDLLEKRKSFADMKTVFAHENMIFADKDMVFADKNVGSRTKIYSLRTRA